MRIKEFVQPGHSSNYYQLTFEDSRTKEVFNILINAYFPIYCSVETRNAWMQLKFIDLPEKIINLIGTEFQFFTSKEFERPPKTEEIQKLDKFEIDQIKYWESMRIGDIVFNGYD